MKGKTRSILCAIFGMSLILFSACAKHLKENKEIAQLFTQYHKEGSFVLYDVQQSDFEGHNFPMYKDSVFLCFSASFPLIALIGIETGLINTEQTPLPILSSQRNLISAFNEGDSMFFKGILASVDSARLQFFLDSIPFGVYQKDANLRQRLPTAHITMDILLGFIKKVYAQHFPFQERTYDILTKAMHTHISTLGGEVYYFDLQCAQRHILMGWVEVRKRPYFFVLQTKEVALNKAPSSIDLLTAILEQLQLFTR